MHTIEDVGRTASVVIELPSGTAILHGEEVELPLREFRLLAELARRVGEAVSTEELIQAIWPDEPWTPKENLYILTTRLRRQIDGSTKFGANIRNRRGFGYVLDLDPKDVIVLDAVAPKRSDDIVIRPEPEEPAEQGSPHGSSGQGSNPRPLRFVPALIGTLIALLAISLAWSAGFAMSSRFASRSESFGSSAGSTTSRSAAPPDTSAPKPAAPTPEPKDDDTDRHATRRERRRGKPERTNPPSATASASSVSIDSPSSVVDQPQDSAQASRKDSENDQPPPEPALPAAPTRYLYHLVNTETGDHFVTTDGSVASEQQAKGYKGGAIARVYTSAEDNTKAITTNHGTAYIFTNSSPDTEPASEAVALWYSTDNDGDFFYTTSKSEAAQDGWSATLIGYVRTLS